MGTCTAFVFAALVEFTFVNYTWRTKGKLPGIPSNGFDNRDYLNTSTSNGDQNRNLLNLEEVRFLIILESLFSTKYPIQSCHFGLSPTPKNYYNSRPVNSFLKITDSFGFLMMSRFQNRLKAKLNFYSESCVLIFIVFEFMNISE